MRDTQTLYTMYTQCTLLYIRITTRAVLNTLMFALVSSVSARFYIYIILIHTYTHTNTHLHDAACMNTWMNTHEHKHKTQHFRLFSSKCYSMVEFQHGCIQCKSPYCEALETQNQNQKPAIIEYAVLFSKTCRIEYYCDKTAATLNAVTDDHCT
jgi:hypothetical protein